MPDCDICGYPVKKMYWWRMLPDLSLCKECWHVFDKIEGLAYRKQLARIAKRLRAAQSRKQARQFLDTFKGTGVPLNERRKPKEGKAHNV